MEEALNRKVRPNSNAVDDGSSAGLIGLDEIEVEEVELGEGFPELSNARVRPSGEAGEGLVRTFSYELTLVVLTSLNYRSESNSIWTTPTKFRFLSRLESS